MVRVTSDKASPKRLRAAIDADQAPRTLGGIEEFQRVFGGAARQLGGGRMGH